ncbi:ABC transporter ATP-binding protein [Marmoricola sp. RAF53]|uniref:ABC transporter ATP-binding protein n=1 Tax=Marmoricola sp. RAF53 TaxID=3233059 RepID=UPI003F9E8B6C
MLSCIGLGHVYRPSNTALSAIDLSFGPEVTGLVGVNGAGKTTLLQVGAGALCPTTGRVSVDGADLYASSRSRRRLLRGIALMPQDFRVPAELRVRDVLAYCAWLRGLGGDVASERVEACLSAVDLVARADERFAALSGGMRRRVALAQALLADPDVLLLDEPTTGLDPEQRAGVRTLLHDLAAQPGGRTIVLSSHVMEDLEALASRIVVIDAGRVVHDGPMSVFRETFGGPERSAETAFLRVVSRHREAS